MTWTSQIGQWAAGFLPSVGSLRVDLLLVILLLAVFFHHFGNRLLSRLPLLLGAILVCSQVFAVAGSWPALTATYPQGIDHPCFLFRLKEFKDIFPFAIGSYNPWWNGGTEHFIGVTSGTHGFAFLTFPLSLLLEPHLYYAFALHFWIFIGMPWLVVFALRSLRTRWTTALTGGLLACCFVRSEFLFFWQSGNVGSMTTAVLTPLLAALAYKVAVIRKGRWPTYLLLVLVAWLSCLWSPGYFTCLGLFVGWLWNKRRWTRPRTARLLLSGVAVLALLAPWLWVTLFPANGIVDYVQSGCDIGRMKMLEDGIRQFIRHLLEWHPVVLVFAFLACFSKRSRPMRRWILPVFAVLSVVAISVGWKRQSQIDRVTIQMAAFALLPAAIECGRLFRPEAVPSARSPIARWEKAFARAVVIAYLLLGARLANCHARNEGGFQFWPVEQSVEDFCKWVRENVPENGRLAFAGATDCKYSWGKPAYFPVLTGREMMSDDYYGFPKGLTERNYPPRYYRNGDTPTMVFFTKAYGITHWAVTDRFYRRFFDENKAHFPHVARFQMQSTQVDIYGFTDQPAPSRSLVGTADVIARENRIDVIPKSPGNDRIVIRYNWRQGLRCMTPGASIAPYQVDENLRFISIRPGGNKEVVIGYSPSWTPLAPNFDGSYHH